MRPPPRRVRRGDRGAGGAARDGARLARASARPGSPASSAPRLEADDGAITFEIRCDRAGDATFAPIAAADPRRGRPRRRRRRRRRARERLGALLADDDADRDRLVDVLAGLRRRGAGAVGRGDVLGGPPPRRVATAADRPMVVVIDDIQWAEPLLLDLLEHLAEWVQDVAAAARVPRPARAPRGAAVARRARPAGRRRARARRSRLRRDRGARGRAARHRPPPRRARRAAPGVHRRQPAVRARARAHARRRRGHPPARRRQWELAIDAEAVEVPPTIQSLLAARVERLPGRRARGARARVGDRRRVQPRRAARARR